MVQHSSFHGSLQVTNCSLQVETCMGNVCMDNLICWECKWFGNDVLLSCGMRYTGPSLLSSHAKSPCDSCASVMPCNLLHASITLSRKVQGIKRLYVECLLCSLPLLCYVCFPINFESNKRQLTVT